MSIILQLYILTLATCAGSLSADSRIFMDVRVDSSVLLPCDCRSLLSTQPSSQILHIEWRTFTETVFERLGEEQYQGEGYEDRVDVPEDELKKGNCSLVLKNIKPEDAGVYESYLLVKRTKRSLQTKRVFVQSVELSVDDTPEETDSAENKPSEQKLRGRSLALSESSSTSKDISSSGVISVPSSIITSTILTINLLFIL